MTQNIDNDSPAPARWVQWLTVGATVALIVAAGAGYLLSNHVLRTAPGDPHAAPVVVVIERGWDLRTIAAELEKSGVVADRRGFEWLARLHRMATQLKAGEYAIHRGLPPQEVLDLLVSGRTLLRRFTVVPGETARHVATRLGTAGLDPVGLAARLIDDPEFARALGVPAAGLEGFLYPETYLYQRNEDAKTLLVRMVKQFQKVWDERFAAQAAGRDMLEIVTLASIVEKESGYEPERPTVARVFLNRLAAAMPLQADPTVIYALGDAYDGNLTRADLQRPDPYNTYTSAGLPPGPICNPGADAIAAVLSPAEGPWKYFVANGEGRHEFTTTYAEHRRAVDRYQRGK